MSDDVVTSMTNSNSIVLTINDTIERGNEMLQSVPPIALHRLYAFLICLSILTVYDLAVACRIRGRWFNVHALANAITVAGCIPSIILWISQPMGVVSPEGQESPDPLGANWWRPEVLFHPSSDWPVLMIIAVHTYHCVAFKLSQQDIFHHFLFVPTLGVGGGLLTNWGPIRNVLSFFISGLPGGIDYMMLVLLKNGKTDKLTCKRLSSKLNVWLRGPGCGVLLPATLYAAYTEGHLPEDMQIRSFFLGLFAMYNGLYYMEMSVKNYQMHLTRDLLTEQHSAEIDKLKAYWKTKETATRQQPSAFDLPAAISTSMSRLSPGRVRKAVKQA